MIARKNIGFVACIALPFSLSPHLRLLTGSCQNVKAPNSNKGISKQDIVPELCLLLLCIKFKGREPFHPLWENGWREQGSTVLGDTEEAPLLLPLALSQALLCGIALRNCFLGSSCIVLLPKFHKQAEGSPLSFRWSVPGLRVPPHTS